jgi:hypothetical protein
MIRSIVGAAASLLLIPTATLPGSAQANSDPQTFFRQNIGLTEDQIASIQGGRPVAKTLPPRTPAEIFLFGAVYIRAAPESYVQFRHDFDRLRKLPNYLALGVFSNPPLLADLNGFLFENDDIQRLKDCRPGDCFVQMPESSIEELNRSINWSDPDVNLQVNQRLQTTALQRLLAYNREGNQALGVYNDQRDPTDVPKQFANMLGYAEVLPERLPDFYRYLLDYPSAKPANVDDTFYWARVDFGLRPTLRVVHLLTRHGNPADPVACAIAEKQLYASHYFETALDLSFCVRAGDDPNQPGFYLIMLMGSVQPLTGLKGSIVRRVAVGRSISNLENALTTIKETLENNR